MQASCSKASFLQLPPAKGPAKVYRDYARNFKEACLALPRTFSFRISIESSQLIYLGSRCRATAPQKRRFERCPILPTSGF